MSLNFISGGSNHRDEVPTFRVPQTSLFLEDSTIQVDESSTASAGGVAVSSVKEKRLERKRQRQFSVIKLYYFTYTITKSKHRKPNFPRLPVLGHASPVLGLRLPVNGKALQL